MKLFEINRHLASVLENGFSADMETGEILFDETDLAALEIAKEEKLEGICLVIKNYNAEAEALKNEEKAFEDRRRQAEKKVDNLKKWLAKELNGEAFKTTRAAVSFRRSESVCCDSLAGVPQEYLRTKEPELDKAKVKQALKNGQQIAGCHLEEKLSMTVK